MNMIAAASRIGRPRRLLGDQVCKRRYDYSWGKNSRSLSILARKDPVNSSRPSRHNYSFLRSISTTPLSWQQGNKPRPTVTHTAPSFRATKVFFTGELETINVKSTELLQTSKIHARDLFDLNLTSRQERRRKTKTRVRPNGGGNAAILPRQTSIVLSFAQIRAIVGRTFVLFLEAHDPTVQEFASELASTYRGLANQQRYSKLRQHSSCPGEYQPPAPPEAMELICLEEVLRHSVESFQRRLRLYDPIVNSFLETVANEVYSDTGVHQLVPLKDSLQNFEIQVRQCLECLTHLLEDDEEMLGLLLTEQAKATETGQPVDLQRHQQVELLLGVYARQLNNILLELQHALQRIQSKQEFVALALAGYRNRMVRMNVTISIATLSLCLGTTVAGFFGMNVINGFEESTEAFGVIVALSSLGGVALGAFSMNYLSGKTMQDRATERLRQIETLTGALSDMAALDYAVKSTLEIEAASSSTDASLSKQDFRAKLIKARQTGEATDAEVDLLFGVLDSVKDGMLNKDDLDLIGFTAPSPVSSPEEYMPSTFNALSKTPRSSSSSGNISNNNKPPHEAT